MTDVLMNLDEWAATQGVSARTVRRWLDADEIPGAGKVKGAWAIPATAVRVQNAAAMVPQAKSQPPAAALPTMDQALATMPAFIDLETASHLLGISRHAIKSHPDYFELVRFGTKGAYVMPKSKIRQLNGD